MADLIEVTLAMDSEDVVKTLKNMEKLEKEIVRLTAGYAKLNQYKGTANLTQKQYAIGTAQLDAKVAHLTTTLNSGGAAINKHAQALVQSKNKMSKFGMVSQQVGYQVGDFFVQVQSGQNMLVAFGQQGTQLAGLLPGLAGAIVGISIAVGTLLVKSFMDAQGETKKLDVAVEDLTSSIDSYLKLSADNVDMTEKIKETYGEVTQQFIELEERIQALSFRQMTLDAMTAAKALGEMNFGGSLFLGETEDIRATFNLPAPKEIPKTSSRAPQKYIDEAKDLQKLMASVNIAMEEGPEAALKATQVLSKFIEESAGGVEKLKGEAAKYYTQVLAAERELTRLVQIKDGALTGAEQNNNKASDKAKEAIADAVELIRIKKAEADLEKLIYTYGEDSVAARTKNADNAARITKAKWEEKFAADGITDQERTLINLLVEGTRLHEQNKDRISDAKDEARELEKALREAATALNSMITFGEGLDKALAVAVAKVKALKADMDETVAGTIAGNLFDAGLKKDKALETTSDPAKIRLITKEYREQVGVAEQLNAVLTEASDIKAAEKAANATEKETPADKLTKEAFALDSKLNKQRAVMGLSGEQLYVEEMRAALVDKIGQEEAKNFTLEIDRVAKILAAKQQLIALEQQRSDLLDFAAQKMGDSLMSIVDGTMSVKDAFRSMAAEVIKELYRVLVVQQMVTAFRGALNTAVYGPVQGPPVAPSAMGNAFSGGNVIPFASGGVVGSPTYFGMGGGQTGLMGEAGPEAIMPLKRGPDGKLGVATTSNSQSVTVVQNINVSTGVQQTVRAEVMGLMPQIAAASKAAVLDAKRRGGSFGGSFR